MAESKVVGDSIRFFSGTVVARMAGLVRGLGVPFLLTEAAQYGLWQVVLVLWQYGMYLHLGSFEYLNRELPGLMVLGKEEERAKLLAQGFWGTLCLAILAAIALVAWPIPQNANAFLGRGRVMFFCAEGLLALQLVSFHILCFRSSAQFGKVSLVSSGMALLGLPLGLGGAWMWGVEGLVGGVALAMTLVALVGFRWNSFPAPRWSLPGFLYQVRSGLPLSLLVFFTGVMPTIAPVVAASMLGLDAVGYLAIAVLMGSLALLLPQTIGTVMYPRFLQAVAESRNQTALATMFQQMMNSVGLLTPFVVCCAAILVAPVLRYGLPQYERSIPLCYVLLASSFFHSFTLAAMFPAQALLKHAAMLKPLVFAVVTAIGFAVFVVLLGGGLLEMALVLLWVHAVLAGVIMAGGLTTLGLKKKEQWLAMKDFFCPGLLFGVVTLVLLQWPLTQSSAVVDFAYAGVRLFILVLCALPLALVWLRKNSQYLHNSHCG